MWVKMITKMADVRHTEPLNLLGSWRRRQVHCWRRRHHARGRRETGRDRHGNLVPPRLLSCLASTPAISHKHCHHLYTNKKHLKNVGPIHHCEAPHAHSPDVTSGTVARRLRIDVHDNTDDDNDNAWQRGPLWPHGMGPITASQKIGWEQRVRSTSAKSKG